MQLPTVKELNLEGSCGETSLLLIRCLMTSDLSWMYDLFKPETLADIIEVTSDLIKIEVESGYCALSPEQITEFKESINAFQESIEYSKAANSPEVIQPNPPHFDPNKRG